MTYFVVSKDHFACCLESHSSGAQLYEEGRNEAELPPLASNVLQELTATRLLDSKYELEVCLINLVVHDIEILSKLLDI